MVLSIWPRVETGISEAGRIRRERASGELALPLQQAL